MGHSPLRTVTLAHTPLSTDSGSMNASGTETKLKLEDGKVEEKEDDNETDSYSDNNTNTEEKFDGKSEFRGKGIEKEYQQLLKNNSNFLTSDCKNRLNFAVGILILQY